MIRQIDTLSYTNAFRSVSPMWKCGFAAVMFVLSYFTHPVLQLATFLWMLVWTIQYARIPWRQYLLLFGISCLFFVTSVPALLLEWGSVAPAAKGTYELITFAHSSVYVTEAGLDQIGKLFVRILACLSCLFFVIFTTPIAELLQVLKRLRCPQLVLEIMLIMYRFVFLLADTASELAVAQRARGGYANFSSKLRDTATLVARLFGKTMQRYRGLSHGLLSRGFADDIGLAPYEAKPVRLRYRVESGAGVLILLIVELVLRWRDMM